MSTTRGARTSPLRPHCLDHFLDANDVDHAREIVSEHTERHFGRDLRQGLAQEVRRAHAHLERAERMLDDFAPRAHRIRVEVKALLHRFKNVFVLPSRDPTLRPRRALRLECAFPARRRPIAPQRFPVLFAGKAISQYFSGWAAISILIHLVDKILLAETALRFRA